MWFRLLCAGIYLLLWVVFGIVYSNLSGEHFYHSNVGREPAIVEYKRHIASEIQQVISNGFIEHYGSNWHWVGNWGVDATTFAVRDLNLNLNQTGKDVEIRFKLSVRIRDKSNNARKVYADPNITFSAAGGSDVASASAVSQDGPAREKLLQVEMPEIPKDSGLWDNKLNDRFPAILFPTKSAPSTDDEDESTDDSEPSTKETQSPSAVNLQIPKQLDNEILNLATGIQGDPSRLKGHVGRMLYLSAVTITTLGYGDISPVTPKARALISAEAVAGIIVIGFLISGGPRPKARKVIGTL